MVYPQAIPFSFIKPIGSCFIITNYNVQDLIHLHLTHTTVFKLQFFWTNIKNKPTFLPQSKCLKPLEIQARCTDCPCTQILHLHQSDTDKWFVSNITEPLSVLLKAKNILMRANEACEAITSAPTRTVTGEIKDFRKIEGSMAFIWALFLVTLQVYSALRQKETDWV